MPVQTVQISVDSTAGTTTITRRAAVPGPGKWRLIRATWMPDTTLAAHATNYAILTLSNAGTSIATTLTSASTAFTAGTARDFVLSDSASRVFSASGELRIAKTVGGSGGTVHGMLTATFEKVPEV